MVEQELEIVENNGYKNINLKPRPMKGIKGLENDNFVILEKTFAEGKAIDGKFGTSYLCGVNYKGEDVSFFLNEKEHQAFAPLGGVGDKVKVTLKKEPWTNPKTGVEMLLNKLYFEAA